MSIRIGIIGAGDIFRQRHFPGLKAIPEAQVVAIANRTKESGRKIADEFGLKVDLVADPLALIARDDLDAVMIGTWPYRHCEFAVAALKAGKHTFVQARMAMNLAEARAMHTAAMEKPHLAAQICPSPMAMQAGPYFGRLIRDGYVGTLRQVFVRSFAGSHVDADRPLHWRDVRNYSGLNAMHMGILVEDLHRWFGTMDQLVAHAQTLTPTRRRAEGGTGEVERPDTIAVAGRFRNGAAVAMTFSGLAPFAAGTTIEVHGSGGSLIYDVDQQVLRGAQIGEKALHEIEVPADQQGQWTVERDFINAIQNGTPAMTTFEEGVKYMEFTEAVFRSVERGSAVRFPLV